MREKVIFAAKSLCGLLFAFPNSLYGLAKWGVCFMFLNDEQKDKRFRNSPWSVFFGRLGGCVLGTLCLLGFLGAIASPLPGTTAIYTLTWLTVLKAYGIGTAWTCAGRALGSITVLGDILSLCLKKRQEYLSEFHDKASAERLAYVKGCKIKEVQIGSTCFLFRAVLLYPFIGEAAKLPRLRNRTSYEIDYLPFSKKSREPFFNDDNNNSQPTSIESGGSTVVFTSGEGSEQGTDNGSQVRSASRSSNPG